MSANGLCTERWQAPQIWAVRQLSVLTCDSAVLTSAAQQVLGNSLLALARVLKAGCMYTCSFCAYVSGSSGGCSSNCDTCETASLFLHLPSVIVPFFSSAHPALVFLMWVCPCQNIKAIHTGQEEPKLISRNSDLRLKYFTYHTYLPTLLQICRSDQGVSFSN